MRTPKNIKEIEKRVKRNKPTTFAERNALNVWVKKHRNTSDTKTSLLLTKATVSTGSKIKSKANKK